MIKPRRVWLIDDDEDDSFFFETALGEIDEPIEFSANLDSVKALCKLTSGDSHIPDLVFLDWNMPKMNGKECLLAIRKLPAYISVPMIIYTTSNALPDKVEAKRLGASFFLTKPNSVRELKTKLKYLFSLDWSKPQTF